MIAYILTVISLILASVMLVLERHNIYRGLRNLAVGAIAGSAVWGGITLLAVLNADTAQIGMADDQVYVMLSTAVRGIPQVMLILLGVGILASTVLLVVSARMQRRSS